MNESDGLDNGNQVARTCVNYLADERLPDIGEGMFAFLPVDPHGCNDAS